MTPLRDKNDVIMDIRAASDLKMDPSKRGPKNDPVFEKIVHEMDFSFFLRGRSF